MKKPAIQFSIVLPCYKEHDRLPGYLQDLKKQLTGLAVELIIVDDGSPAESFNLLKSKIAGLLNAFVKLERYENNQGKGFAIAYGIGLAKGRIVGFVDSDGAIPAHEVRNALDYYIKNDQYDMLVFSRIKMLGKSVERSFMRHLSGRIFVTIISLLFGIPVYDSQCGFKLFKKEIYELLKCKITDTRWVWDTQLLILFYINNRQIKEIPIDWKDIAGSKVKIIQDSARMLFKMLSFKRGLM